MPPDLASLPPFDADQTATAVGGNAAGHLPGYLGMVRRLDDALGRVTDALKSLDILDNTVVLFTSDHGCHFKTRNHEYKRSCHEASIRVPSLLHGGPFTGGGRVSQLVSLVDLPPTLLDACGITPPDTMQGRSLLPLINGPRDQEHDWPEEVFVQYSEACAGRAVRTQRWKYAVENHDPAAARARHNDRYDETFLYDLKHDPWELNNLIASQAHDETCAVMRDRLLRRMREAGEPEPVINPAATKTKRPAGR